MLLFVSQIAQYLHNKRAAPLQTDIRATTVVAQGGSDAVMGERRTRDSVDSACQTRVSNADKKRASDTSERSSGQRRAAGGGRPVVGTGQ